MSSAPAHDASKAPSSTSGPPPAWRPRLPKALFFGGLATLALLLGAAAGHFYLSHGLTARYEAIGDGGRFDVTSTVEHRFQFPTEHRALSRYVQEWDFEARGIPTQMPQFRATFAGTVEIPGPHAARLRVRSSNRARLFLDGRELDSEVGPGEEPAEVAPGAHQLRVIWEGRFEERHPHRSLHTDLAIESQASDGTWGPLPEEWTRPKQPASGELALLWAGVAGLWLLLCLPIVLALLGDPDRRRGRLTFVALAAILVLGAGYRLFDYAVMPNFQENGDELFATWNGWQLLTDGSTRGWSLWAGAYGDIVRHESLPYWNSQGGGWHIIRPYFEHPPLAHLLVGAAAKLGGAHHFAHSRLKHTRLVPIALSILTMILMFFLGRELAPRKRAGVLLGILLYAALPLIAIQNRAIKEEMLLVPMELLSLWLFLRWRASLKEREGGSDTLLLSSAFLAGATCLAKVTGAMFVPALMLLIATTGRWKAVGKAALAGTFAVALLFLYGAIVDWDAFLFTTLRQATGRPSHWNLFPRFFADGLIIHNLIFHGPTLFLWLSGLVFLGGRGRRIDPAWIFFPVTYLIGMAVSSGNWTFGWYMLPTYPFLCLAAGCFLEDLWRRPNPLYGLLFMGLLVMYGLNFIAPTDYFKRPEIWPVTRAYISIFVVLMLGPYFAAYARPRWADLRALARAATVAGLLLFVGLSGYFIARYDVLYETHHEFDRDTFFDR